MLFQVENVCKHFGGVQVLKGMSMQIERGEVVGIMGPNGAGKTTLINMISGLERVDAGEVRLQGENITNLDSYLIAQKGIRRSFQTTSNFPDKSIGENIRAALIGDVSIGYEQEMKEVDVLLDEVGMLEMKDKHVSEVLIAFSKLVELCRCLVSKPLLVLLDELYAGLTWEESKLVTKLIKEKKRELGTSFVLIEHRTEILFDAVDRIVVLNEGTDFFEGLPEEVAANEEVSKLYWGK